MRAVLLASATATTSGGRRRRSPITHGSALVAFERSRLALAPLIRSRRKYWLPRLDMPPIFAAGGILPRAITPNSARCARRAFTTIVRWRVQQHGGLLFSRSGRHVV